MYATIHRFRRPLEGGSDDWARSLPAGLYDGMSPVGVCVLGRLDSTDGTAFALWSTQQEAVTAAARPVGEEQAHDARSYRVAQHCDGLAAGQQARFAQLTWFDGGGRERADAQERAGLERIWPAVREVDGVVGMYALRGDDHDSVVIGLSTSVETTDAVRRAIFSTELLPWENPAHLTGPSRVDDDRVLFAQLPAEVRS
jgi:hypothetical protein